MADDILILRDGQLIQRGLPRQVYDRPIDEYAAALLGDYTLTNGEYFRPEAQTAFFFSTHP